MSKKNKAYARPNTEIVKTIEKPTKGTSRLTQDLKTSRKRNALL